MRLSDCLASGTLLFVFVVACGGAEGGGDAALEEDAGEMASDAGPSSWDAGDAPDAGPPAPSSLAPDGAMVGEVPGVDGARPIVVGGDGLEAAYRVDAAPDEHIAFVATFADRFADVEMALWRWDGEAPQRLGVTDGGRGLRTLAAYDADGPRTFWVQLSTAEAEPVEAELEITRTPYTDAPVCTNDCELLLQLPLPNDPAFDGYDYSSATVFRYQFGRRDLVMFIRYAGATVAGMGLSPFVPEDLSQWDGETPGVDVGALRHASHQRGKDVDISLYGLDGSAHWRSFCETHRPEGGRECIAGSATDLDGWANAIMYGGFLQSGRVTMSFLDEELIPIVIAGAADAVARGDLDPGLEDLYSDGRRLQHWPNHDNHIHIRISEMPYDGTSFTWMPFDEDPVLPP